MYSDYNRNNRYNDDYQDRNYQNNSRDNFNDNFNDHYNRDIYEYRDRVDGRDRNYDKRDFDRNRERTTFSPDPQPREYSDKQLGRGIQFNDKFRNLFQKKEKTYRNDYQPIQENNDLEKDFVIYSPKSYADIKKMIDFLRNNQPVIVNLGTLKQEKGQRILDFMSGAIYALNGKSHKITNSIYLLTPNGVNIMVPTELMQQIKKDND